MKEYMLGKVLDVNGRIVVEHKIWNGATIRHTPSKLVLLKKGDSVIGHINDVDGNFNVIAKTAIVNVDPDSVSRAVCGFINENQHILLSRKYNNVSPYDFYKKTRERNVVVARQLSHFLYRFIADKPLMDISELFGKKNHATVIHSIRTMLSEFSTNKLLVDEIQGLVNRIINPDHKDSIIICQHNFNTCQQ
jgi:small nuclear ribonucleoprotein (snRNP)-like protein